MAVRLISVCKPFSIAYHRSANYLRTVNLITSARAELAFDHKHSHVSFKFSPETKGLCKLWFVNLGLQECSYPFVVILYRLVALERL